MPCPPNARTPSPEDVRRTRRAAALERLSASGEAPALIAQAQASLAAAFSLSDLLGRTRG